MKRVLAISAGAVVAVVLVALIALRVTGLEPKERRPGLWLSGERVTAPAGDWSFTDAFPTIAIETRSWYLLPHSVTITCVALDGRLYLTAVYRDGMPFPQGKRWTANVMRDPRVRLKIGDRVFDATVTLVTDPAERAAALVRKAAKYPGQRVPATATVYVFRVGPGSSAR